MVRDLVGGGGKAKFVLTVGTCDDRLEVEAASICLGAIAGGPRLKNLSTTEMEKESLEWISVKASGVGGRFGRGIVEKGNSRRVCYVFEIQGDCKAYKIR